MIVHSYLVIRTNCTFLNAPQCLNNPTNDIYVCVQMWSKQCRTISSTVRNILQNNLKMKLQAEHIPSSPLSTSFSRCFLNYTCCFSSTIFYYHHPYKRRKHQHQSWRINTNVTHSSEQSVLISWRKRVCALFSFCKHKITRGTTNSRSRC